MTGENPNIMTRSHVKHCMKHKQSMAEITPNIISHDWSDRRPTTPHGRFHCMMLRGVFERDVPGVEKSGNPKRPGTS